MSPKGSAAVSEREAGSGPDLEGKLVGGRAEKARVDRGGRSGDVPQRGEILRRRDGPDGVSRVRLIDGDHLAVVGCIDQVEGEAREHSGDRRFEPEAQIELPRPGKAAGAPPGKDERLVAAEGHIGPEIIERGSRIRAQGRSERRPQAGSEGWA